MHRAPHTVVSNPLMIQHYYIVYSACTKPGHLSFVDITKLVMPTSPMLLLARLQDNDDHMISVAVSHDLRVIDRPQTEQWLQTFQNVLHKL